MLTRYHIHIVDDELTNIILLEKMLKNDGFKVSISRSGIECLEQVQEVRPDIILLDVMMPEMSGFETCKHIRKNPELADVPVIFVTALDDRDAITKAYKSGATDYVVKPVRLDELREKIRTVLQMQNLVKDKSRLLKISSEAIVLVRYIMQSLSMVKKADNLKDAVERNNDTVCDLLQQAKLALANNDSTGVEASIEQSLGLLQFTDKTGAHLSAFAEALEMITSLMEGISLAGADEIAVKKADHEKIDELIARLDVEKFH